MDDKIFVFSANIENNFDPKTLNMPITYSTTPTPKWKHPGYLFILSQENYLNKLVEYQKIFDSIQNPILIYINSNKYIHLPNNKKIKSITPNNIQNIKWFKKNVSIPKQNNCHPFIIMVIIIILCHILLTL